MDLIKPTGYSAEIFKQYYIPKNNGQKKVKSLIQNAVKFQLPDNGMLIDVANIYTNGLNLDATLVDFQTVFSRYISELKLPYPTIMLEFDFATNAGKSMPFAMIAEQSDDNIFLSTCTKNGNFWNIKQGGIIIYQDFSVKINFNTESVEENKTINIILKTVVYILFCFLAALNCSNVKQQSTPRLKTTTNTKGNPKKNKQPFFSYKVLTIDTQNQQSQGNTTGSGNHASPRVHLRRGHIRRLPNKTVWVNACVVGDKSKGMVSKDYAVDSELLKGVAA